MRKHVTKPSQWMMWLERVIGDEMADTLNADLSML